MAAPTGTARIMQADSNFLTHFNDNAVVGLGQEREWKIRPAGTNNVNAVVIILKDDSGEDKCLTLDSQSDDPEATNILLKPVQSPPSLEQCWTMENAIVQPRYPPICHGRLQSCAKKNCSAAVGGMVPLPRIFMNVAAVPHEDGDMDRFRWRMDYTSME